MNKSNHPEKKLSTFKFYFPVVILAILGISLSVFGYYSLSKHEQERARVGFERLANKLSADLQKSIELNLETIQSLRDFYVSSQTVERSEFHSFAEGIFSRRVGVRTLEWVPRVKDSELENFETLAHREASPAFRIQEIGGQEKNVPLGRRSEHYPIYYVEPFEKFKFRLGDDLASDVSRREMLEKARDSGEISTTQPIRLLSETGGEIGFLVCAPVYVNDKPHNTLEDRRQNLQGFVVGSWRIDEFIKSSLNVLLLDGIDFYLYDGPNVSDEFLFYHFEAINSPVSNSPEKHQTEIRSPFKWITSFQVAERPWTVLYRPKPEYLAERSTRQPWAVLMTGFIMTMFFIFYLLLILRRGVLIEKIVTRRTSELSESNVMLQNQILERHQAEEALRVSDGRHREVASNIPGAVYQFVLRPDGSMAFPYMSESISKITGIASEEIRLDGSKPFTRILPEDLPLVNQSILESAKTMTTWLREFRIKTMSGEIKWLRATSSPNALPDGSILWNGVILDVTDLKFAELHLKELNEELRQKEQKLLKALEDLRKTHQELKETQAQLIQAEKMDSIGRLAAGVAHEVKNPLAIIMQCIDYVLLSAEIKDENVRSVLNDMSEAIERADSVIVELLDFASLSEAKKTSENLNSILEESLLLVKHELDRHHIKVVKNFSDALPAVRINKNRVQQVFVNILLNAFQATPEGSELKVTTFSKRLQQVGGRVGRRKSDIFRPGSRVIVVEIQDTGSGVSEELLDKIFEPFFTTRRGKGGTGLGLSVVKSIMEMHQGSVEITNNAEGPGATVILTFNVQETEENYNEQEKNISGG